MSVTRLCECVYVCVGRGGTLPSAGDEKAEERGRKRMIIPVLGVHVTAEHKVNNDHGQGDEGEKREISDCRHNSSENTRDFQKGAPGVPEARA